jgi:hypothetical protein
MKYEINVPEYAPQEGMRLEWEDDFHISTSVDAGGIIIIKANSAGLVSLARHLLLLSQAPMPSGRHIHLDPSNSLEEGSNELILERE